MKAVRSPGHDNVSTNTNRLCFLQSFSMNTEIVLKGLPKKLIVCIAFIGCDVFKMFKLYNSVKFHVNLKQTSS